jgi:hypothetical protein
MTQATQSQSQRQKTRRLRVRGGVAIEEVQGRGERGD